MSNREIRSTTIDDFLDGIEQEVAEGTREHAVVWAPSPVHDPGPSPEMERPVLDGGQWREFSAVQAETKGEPILITPPTFDTDEWAVQNPDASGVTPHKSQQD
jgi:hypothetical protein